jgi:hypothetical protein
MTCGTSGSPLTASQGSAGEGSATPFPGTSCPVASTVTLPPVAEAAASMSSLTMSAPYK